jgi:hypothetical protein
VTPNQSTVQLELPAKRKRRKAPSRAVTNGAVTGGGIGVALDIALWAFGVPVPPGAGAALGSLVSTFVAYWTRGGRKNEPE